MIYKRAKVEFHPLGVIGAIVSWNYPFHNILNPMLAAVFSGNSIVIKVFHVGNYNTDFNVQHLVSWIESICLSGFHLSCFNISVVIDTLSNNSYLSYTDTCYHSLVTVGFRKCKLVWMFLLPNYSSCSCCCRCS